MQHTNTSSMSSGSTTCLFYRDLGARRRRPSPRLHGRTRTLKRPKRRDGGVSDASEEKKVSSATKSEAYNAVLFSVVRCGEIMPEHNKHAEHAKLAEHAEHAAAMLAMMSPLSTK